MLVINLAQQAEPVVEAKKEERPKSPSILAKLLAPFKGDKKEKAEKKPKEKAKKTEKKEEVCATVALCYLVLTCTTARRCPRGRGGA